MKNILNYFKSLIFDMPQEYWDDANKYVEAIRDNKRVKRAIKLAKLRSKTDGKKRYVLRDWNNNPVPLTRKDIEMLKVKGIMSRNVNAFYLEKEALFVTK